MAAALFKDDGTFEPFHMEGFINVRTVVRIGRLRKTRMWESRLGSVTFMERIAKAFALDKRGDYFCPLLYGLLYYGSFFGDVCFRGIDPGYLMGIARFIQVSRQLSHGWRLGLYDLCWLLYPKIDTCVGARLFRLRTNRIWCI